MLSECSPSPIPLRMTKLLLELKPESLQTPPLQPQVFIWFCSKLISPISQPVSIRVHRNVEQVLWLRIICHLNCLEGMLKLCRPNLPTDLFQVDCILLKTMYFLSAIASYFHLPWGWFGLETELCISLNFHLEISTRNFPKTNWIFQAALVKHSTTEKSVCDVFMSVVIKCYHLF